MTQIPDQIASLSPAHRELFARLQSLQAPPPAAVEPIAIVGMGCRFPGGANDAESFWELLAGARDAVTEVPRDRWDWAAWYDRNPATPGKMTTRHGGFLDSVDQFDAEFFGVSPREAAYIDPQHRLLLETTWEAFEHAGIAPDRLHGSPTGVFLGLSTFDYYRLAFSDPGRVGPYCATGTFASAGAGRISYTLGLQGPSLAIDTACSSSLVAVHYACQSLRLKECTLAVAGGASLMVGPELSIGLTKAHMLAPDGRCKTFDAAADGYGRGEGCGVVVLKTLADAQRDGDTVWGVIAGSAVNQDGRSNGLTAPNGPAQEALLRTALKAADMAAADVTYVEAHGTGTSLGDPVEAGALAAVFGEGRPKDRPLVVGSVKSNFGHLEMAAGIAGLIKTVLCLSHRQIPPNLHFRKLNPGIAAATVGVSLHVPTQVETWHPAGDRFLAGVSSFGFGGTNAHVLLTNAPQVAQRASRPKASPQLLCLSARTSAALRELAGRYLKALSRSDASVADICYTAAAGRAHFDCRFAAVGITAAELSAKLAAFRDEAGASPRRQSSSAPLAPRLVFALVGGGRPQFVLDWYTEFPVFRRVVDRCLESLDSLEPAHSLRALLFNYDADRQDARTITDDIALFVVQAALAELWNDWGVVAECFLAEAGSEAAGAYLAGAVSLEDGLKLAARTAHFRHASAASRDDAAAARMLANDLATISFQPLTGRLVTTATGKDVTVLDLADPAFWSPAPAAPNGMGEDLQLLRDFRDTVCLELGLTGSLHSGQGRTCPQLVGGSAWRWLSCRSDEIGGPARVLEILRELYVHQVPVDWQAFYRDCSLARVSLPTYPFQRERYWLEREPGQAPRQVGPSVSSNGNGAHPVSTAPPPSATAPMNGNRRMPRAVAPSRPTDRPLAVHAHAGHANPDHLRKVFEDCLIRVLELPDGRRIPPDQDLLDLGMDSITAMEMLFAVEKSLGRPLRMPGIAKSRTINQFIALMESCAGAERAAPSVS